MALPQAQQDSLFAAERQPAATAAQTPPQQETPPPSQRIKLYIDGTPLPLTVHPQEEEVYRKAAALLNARIAKFKSAPYKAQSMPDNGPLIMAALLSIVQETALRLEREQQSAYAGALQGLNHRLEALAEQYALPQEPPKR